MYWLFGWLINKFYSFKLNVILNIVFSNIIMDPEFEGEESPHKLDEKIVNINDYS